MLDLLIREAEALALPCFDLVPAAGGDEAMAYWGGTRSDLPKVPPFVGAVRSTKHILSVDSTLWIALDLKGRGPFALAIQTMHDDSEQVIAFPVSSGTLAGISFEGAVPLQAVKSVSLPPLEAVLLYGGPAIDAWLNERGLRRWNYEDAIGDDVEGYRSYFFDRSPLLADPSPFARVGGWHICWSDDDFYIPREMRLMLWTFEGSEPWYEVFLSGLLNHVVKARIT